MADRRAVIEAIAADVVDAALTVHKALGPGLLESSYQACLAHELQRRGRVLRCEVILPVHYNGVDLDTGYRGT